MSLITENLKEYNAYKHAKWRCSKTFPCPHCGEHIHEFKDYGGRDISFEYESFEHFIEDLGPAPSPDHSLDRADNDGNYEKGNCRWSLKSEQQKNRGHNGEWFPMNKDLLQEVKQ